jgi:hypothetical protein
MTKLVLLLLIVGGTDQKQDVSTFSQHRHDQKSEIRRTTCGVERRNGNGKSQAATLILYQTRRFGA